MTDVGDVKGQLNVVITMYVYPCGIIYFDGDAHKIMYILYVLLSTAGYSTARPCFTRSCYAGLILDASRSVIQLPPPVSSPPQSSDV